MALQILMLYAMLPSFCTGLLLATSSWSTHCPPQLWHAGFRHTVQPCWAWIQMPSQWCAIANSMTHSEIPMYLMQHSLDGKGRFDLLSVFPHLHFGTNNNWPMPLTANGCIECCQDHKLLQAFGPLQLDLLACLLIALLAALLCYGTAESSFFNNGDLWLCLSKSVQTELHRA